MESNRLVDELPHVRSFEEAAEAALSTALEVTSQALARSPFAATGRILRAMLHLRPNDGYLRLVVLEMADRGVRGACRVGDGNHLPSATAWRWVTEHDASVAIDVELMSVNVYSSRARFVATDAARPFDAEGSRIKLTGRDVTHLFVVPLRAPGHRIEGMLSIEASCQQAMGTPFIWEACGPELATVAAIASPYVMRLPITRIETTTPDKYLPVIGSSMQRVVEMLRVFARQEETILLSGPTGAGKSRLARWCHERSPAQGHHFETIDLATVPEELQMAELFGWKKGAFTGATKDTPGCISRAERGTLFIDEIDKLSLKAQAGLLRVLEEKRYRPLGEGAGDRSANVRFIIGTNADLHQLSRKGAFRADLYYRINVLPVKIPPLGDRPDEIVSWAEYMLSRRHEASGSTCQAKIEPEAARRLLTHDWPGNLRQLDNIVRRAYALSLVDQDDAAERILLTLDHVERALAYEGQDPPRGVWEHLVRAADAFVDEALRRADAGHPRKLDMDLIDGFKGLVLDSARRRFTRDEKEALRSAFILLGKEAMVQSRNHGAQWKREEEKMVALRRALEDGGESPA